MSGQAPENDPVVAELRARIGELDRAVLAAVNERVELVRELRDHKLARGYEFVDRPREERILSELAGANGGPLSERGVRELFKGLLALTKREVAG